MEKYLVGKGMVCGGGSTQYGGFLGMLASIGIPLAIDLVKKMLGKGMEVGPSRSRRSAPLPPPPRSGKECKSILLGIVRRLFGGVGEKKRR